MKAVVGIVACVFLCFGVVGPVGSQSVVISTSPAGCKIAADNAHPSGHQNDTVNNTGGVRSCAWNVSMKSEVWGERHSWSGWRNFSPKDTDIKYGRSTYGQSAARCLSGTYDYKTRGSGWTYEGGTEYYGNVHGNTGRIKQVPNGLGVKCVWD